MKIAITGADGFIGSHLVSELKKNSKIKVIEFDANKHNLFDVESLRQLIDGCDAIVHLAGLNRASEIELIRTNVLGTLNLLDAIKKYSNKAMIIFASSFQVYEPLNKPQLVDEKTVLNPQTAYGYSKKFAEELIRLYAKEYGINGVILRISNVYGPGCKPNYNSVIATFCYKAIHGEALYVNDREASRDYIYVKDLVNAIKKCLKYNIDGVEVFNVCSGRLFSLQDIIEILSKNIKINVKYGKVNEQKYLLGDNTKIARLLNFKTEVEFEQGLNETLKSYKNE